jgi:hypothetical protein
MMNPLGSMGQTRGRRLQGEGETGGRETGLGQAVMAPNISVFKIY